MMSEAYPELRAYLMNLAGEGGSESFFDSLAL